MDDSKRIPDEFLDALDSPERRRKFPPEDVVEKMGYLRGMIIVDYGCGLGYFTFPLANEVGPEGKVYAIDVNERIIGNLGDKVGQASNIVIRLCDGKSIPVGDSSVDIVFTADVFHEFSREERSVWLNDVKRILKPDGRLLIIDWDPSAPDVSFGPPPHHRIPKEQALSDCRTAGFRKSNEIHHDRWHYWLEFIA